MKLSIIKILSLLFFLFPPICQSAVFKCVIDGKTRYAAKPCIASAADKIEEIKIKINKTTAKPSLLIGGFVMENGKKMEIKDSVAIIDRVNSESASYEVHVYFYPFKLSDEDKKAIKDFKGRALSIRNDQDRNPDQNIWELPPIVELQFVVDDTGEPIARDNIKHWRFVSWMQRTPATLNTPKDTLAEALQTVDEKQGEDGRILTIASNYQQTFDDRTYRWEINVDTPLLTTTR